MKLVGLVGALLTLAPLGAVEAMPVVAPLASGTVSSADGASVEKTQYYGYRRPHYGYRRHYGWHRAYGWHRPYGWRRHHRYYRNF